MTRFWQSCVEGIHRLNAGYGSGQRRPVLSFPSGAGLESRVKRKWMGYERKRGKLNDLNRLLLGEGNWFETIAGDLSRLLDVPLCDYARYRHAIAARNRGEDGRSGGASAQSSGDRSRHGRS